MPNRSDKPCGGCGNKPDPNLELYPIKSTFGAVKQGESFYAVGLKRVMVKTETHMSGCCTPNDNARCPVSGMLALLSEMTIVGRKAEIS